MGWPVLERIEHGFSLRFPGYTEVYNSGNKSRFMKQESVLYLEHVEFEGTEELQDRDINGQNSEMCERMKSLRKVLWGRQREWGLRLDPWYTLTFKAYFSSNCSMG